MSARALVYAYPVFLVLLEWIFRQALGLNAGEFMGPTLAAVGASLILPVTIPQKRNFAFSRVAQAELAKMRVVVRSVADGRLINVAWMSVFFATAIWMASMFYSSRHPEENLWQIPVHTCLGIVNCLIGIILCEVKELV